MCIDLTGKLPQDSTRQNPESGRTWADTERTWVNGSRCFVYFWRGFDRCVDTRVSHITDRLQFCRCWYFILLQPRTALVVDAVTRRLLGYPACLIPLRYGLRLWRAQCDVLPPVRALLSYVGSSDILVSPHRWLGQNSKQNKLSRALGDVQIRMRLKVSGDKSEIRQSYLPALFPHIVKPLIDVGAVCLFPFSLLFSPGIRAHCSTHRALWIKSLTEWTSITCPKRIGIPLSSWALTKIRTN